MSKPTRRPGSAQELAVLLQQLRHRPQAQPRPFFYERVHARLAAARQPASPWLTGWARRPAYLALLGMLVLAVSSDGTALPPVATTHYDAYPAGPPAVPPPR